MYKEQDANDRPRNFVQVATIDAAITKFQQTGGTIVVGKQEVPGQG